MSAWGLAWRIVDTLLGVAIRADELAERRRARKKFRELVEARAKDAARSKAPTVVLRRRPPPPPR